ncbi:MULTISPECIES: GPW/gp25 family protein [Cysteiniphilum]|uniref:Baseplate assembly protein n=1 Tax=Cysteiniphilum litorale TaxID=2056700 RepID=A0A8J3E9P3_9GAMM|nr:MULTISPECIES: GPW/gp25 family protein [Cysteiniphilum]GGG02955.1 baseplate assembly protein [Cysteiniphilum litorale]
MHGVDRYSGRVLDDVEHVKQSIKDILTTPIGTRVQLRAYGSRLFEYIDKPMNNENVIQIILASAEAIDTWEPRVKLTRVLPTVSDSGRLNIDVEFTYQPNGKPAQLRGVML